MGKRSQKAKKKALMMAFEVKMQEDRCRCCPYNLNCKKTEEVAYLEEEKNTNKVPPNKF